MTFALGPVARASGYRLLAYDTIGSTSAEAMRLAHGGDTGRLWVVADEQTAGHGRRGRSWQAPQGNLSASVLMPALENGAQTATLGFAAGLALDTAIRTAAPRLADGVQLKWPNDVLIGGAKVAGILLEAVNLPGGNAVVVGIGVNIRAAPADLPYPATSLAESGAAVTAEAVFAALADAWVEQEALWNAGNGFPAIRDRWLTHAAGLGAPVAVSLGAETLRGTFETIDETGRLVVRTRDGAARSVSAGEVYFGAAASARP